MAKRTRSNTSAASQNSQEAAKRSKRSSQNTSAVDATVALVPVVEEETTEAAPAIIEEPTAVIAKTTTITTAVEEYTEDLIDYSDSDLEPVSKDASTKDAGTDAAAIEDEPAKPTPEEQAIIDLEQGKAGMAWSTYTLLTTSAGLASALRLTSLGASVSTTATFADVTYEITWKVTNIGGVDAPTTAPTTAAAKCKFGKHCTKGAACPFDHTPKQKLCIWVNSLGGCSNGAACAHSHEHEGAKCTRSKKRSQCANGKACAYQHQDDVYVSGSMQRLGKKDVGEKEGEGDGEEGKTPTGLKLGKGAGQKRGVEGGEDGRAAQRQRGNDGRGGGGRGRGRGRGRGAGRGRPGGA
ncbi:hypothetical protein CC86DRAFT_470672 [Ophiobolus disseminans]|uniref:C3H1-type domain-containing protein n=1 Tax=Ophiobolus disseminans TaxID=1469910 RepID=A0A6A6ZML1_9PLEO|nr:hypothetical protein CC86DRAFT_470672 [Ophiobolus disseminans]